MDNLTHTLFALTLARTPLARAGRGTTAALILASSAPDIDVVASAGGALSYLQWHRGPTHGPLGVIGLGLATAGLVWAARRLFDRGGDGAGASFPALAMISMVGVLLHILMDVPTLYGTRIFSPVDSQWYAVSWVPIIDIYLLTVLLGGLLIGSRRAWSKHDEGPDSAHRARHWNAAVVLTLMLANYGLRGAAHHAALSAAPDAFGPALPQPCARAQPAEQIVERWSSATAPSPHPPEAPACLVEVVALPSFVSPFEWRLIARLSNAYETREVNVLERLGESRASQDTAVSGRGAQRYPDEWTPVVVAAAQSEVGRAFLGFARFPAARSVVETDGTSIVQWTDVRFSSGATSNVQLAARRSDLFTVTVRVAPDGRILEP